MGVASVLEVEMARLAISEPVPTETGSELPCDNAQHSPRSIIPSPKRGLESATNASHERNMHVLSPGPRRQTQVLNERFRTSTAWSTIPVPPVYPPIFYVPRYENATERCVASILPPCICRILAPALSSAFSTQSLFGASDWRTVAVSGRKQSRFQNAPPELNDCMKMEMFEQGGLPLGGPLSGALKPTIQGVLDAIVQAVGPTHFKPQLIIRCNWTFNSAYSFWSTINMPLGQLLQFKSLGGLAWALAHELGHILAAHQVEFNALLHGTERAFDLFQSREQWCLGLGNIGVMMFYNEMRDLSTKEKQWCAFGRLGEYEADYIGILLMAKAGFDPREALAFARERELEESAYLKTTQACAHPSWQNRITFMESQLDAAMALFEGAESKESMVQRFEDLHKVLNAAYHLWL